MGQYRLFRCKSLHCKGLRESVAERAKNVSPFFAASSRPPKLLRQLDQLLGTTPSWLIRSFGRSCVPLVQEPRANARRLIDSVAGIIHQPERVSVRLSRLVCHWLCQCLPAEGLQIGFE